MIVTVSQLKDFLKCPQLAYYTHELHRVPPETPAALELGTMFHELMQIKLSSGLRQRFTELNSWLDASDEAKVLWAKHRLWIPIEIFEIPTTWEIIAVEKALKSRIYFDDVNYIELQGRLDGVVKYNGKYWSLQWKTYTDDLNNLIDRVRLGWHEVAYEHLARDAGYEPWGGTILGACQKLPGYRMIKQPDEVARKYVITDEDRSAVFTTHFITRSSDVQTTLMRNLNLMLYRMYQDWRLQVRNLDSCFGPYGRGRCQYFEVCHGGADINGEGFKTAEERY